MRQTRKWCNSFSDNVGLLTACLKAGNKVSTLFVFTHKVIRDKRLGSNISHMIDLFGAVAELQPQAGRKLH